MRSIIGQSADLISTSLKQLVPKHGEISFMNWVSPNNSRTRVGRAGNTLISEDASDTEIKEAINVLSNWRAAHAYPMHALLVLLRRKARIISKKSIVAQRLKRTPSIINKLRRFPAMRLNRMQDIAGCRAVVTRSKQVRKLAKALSASRTRHTLHKVDDYISYPKTSGYRGVHLVFKYNASKVEFKGQFVELQLRSRIQHAWATAVEIVDAFTEQALKTTGGEPDWIDFFRFASAEFAKQESEPVAEDVEGVDTRSKLANLEKKLSAIDQLKAFAVTANLIQKKMPGRRTDYYLLFRDDQARTVNVQRFSSKEFDRATNKYLLRERQISEGRKGDVVLVSAESVQSLQVAYPNYFADSAMFVDLLRGVLHA